MEKLNDLCTREGEKTEIFSFKLYSSIDFLSSRDKTAKRVSGIP
jgi:hypothetical protein